MKKLSNILIEDKSLKLYNDIELSMITESLHEPHLISIAKQLRKFADKDDNYNDGSFAGILGRFQISWDKVTSSEVQEFKAGDKNGIKLAKIPMKQWDKGGSPAVFVLIYPKDRSASDDFDYILSWAGLMNLKRNTWDYKANAYIQKPGPWSSLNRQYELVYKLQDRDFVVIDARNLQTNSLQSDRRNAQENMVLMGDEKYYKKLAEENKERYERIIAQNKANKMAVNDQICEHVQKIINDVLQLSIELAKNPVKYADVQYSISSLIQMIHSKRTYYKGQSSGQDGLLIIFNNYLSAFVDTAQGSQYKFVRDNVNKYHAELEKMLAQLDQEISKIEEKMS